MNKNKLFLTVAVLMVIAITGLFFPTGNTIIERIERNVGANPGPDFYNALEFNAGVKYGSVNSTSTLASMTLRVEDVMNFDTVIIKPTGAAATKVLTFFASSTASHWLPQAGDTQKTCVLNATTTAATTITFAGGTGIDLQTASSSPTDLILLADNTACFTFTRKAKDSTITNSFNIEASFVEYTDGD
ncbi:MAG: hypothetical protein AAB706_01545 [Patescibacteria group bacterium]